MHSCNLSTVKVSERSGLIASFDKILLQKDSKKLNLSVNTRGSQLVPSDTNVDFFSGDTGYLSCSVLCYLNYGSCSCHCSTSKHGLDFLSDRTCSTILLETIHDFWTTHNTGTPLIMSIQSRSYRGLSNLTMQVVGS